MQRRRLFEEGCKLLPSISQSRFTYKWCFLPIVWMFKQPNNQEKIVFYFSSASCDISSHDCSKFINNKIANYTWMNWVREWCLWEATSWSAISDGALWSLCNRHSSASISLSIQLNLIQLQNTATCLLFICKCTKLDMERTLQLISSS